MSADKQWFEDASFGLFVHWGLSAVDGTVEISWAMLENKPFGQVGERDVTADLPDTYLAPEDYFALADEFDPDSWDPDEWVGAARRAGMDYAVLTTKHHDGFALWPSEYGEFSTAQYLDGRDLVGEFVEACRRHDMKIGLYFSLPDWHHPDFPRPERWGDYAQFAPKHFGESGPVPLETDELERFERYFRYVKGQLRELLTGYGDLDVLWFDLDVWRDSMDDRVGDLYQLVEAQQPHLVTNDRGYGYGDYQTPENVLPEEPMDGRWELCQVWAPPAWAYHVDEEYRDLDWTLERLAKTVSRGGNFLLNVGPKPDGELPDEAYERFDELATWMDHSEAAFSEVDAGPWPPRADVPVTRRNGVWYVHVLEGTGETVKLRDVPEPSAVRRLRTNEEVSYTTTDDGIAVTVPESADATPDEVLAVTWPAEKQHLL
jgi:alpha-L-fucosidase